AQRTPGARGVPPRARLPARDSASDRALTLRGNQVALGAEGVPEPLARCDLELDERVVQMPLHGASAEEELCGDLRVGEAIAGEPRDLLLLRRQLVAQLGAALAHGLARRQELAPGPLCERLHPDPNEQPVGRAQLFA